MESFNNFIAESFDPKNTYKIISVEESPDEKWFETEDRTRKGDPNEFNDSPEDRSVTFKFKSDSGTYFDVVYSTKWNAEKWDWELVFVNKRKNDGSYITGTKVMGGFETKEVVKIFNTVMKTMNDMINKTVMVGDVNRKYRVHSINFKADAAEPSRVKLYKRMFLRFTKELDEFKVKYSMNDEPDEKNFINFKIQGTTGRERNEMRRKRKEDREKKEQAEKEEKEKKKENEKEKEEA